MVCGCGIPGCEKNKMDVKMEISEERVLKDIKNILEDKEKTAELAKKVEKSYINLYHDVYAIREWEKGTKIYSNPNDSNDSITFEKNREGNQYFEIRHYNPGESAFSIFIEGEEDKVAVQELGYFLFSKKGSFEDVFKFYSKKDRKETAKRIKSIITIPQEILEAAKRKEKEDEESQKGNGLETLLQQSEEKLFDLKILKDTYYSNPKTFKQLFELATDEQKKKVIQDLIKTKEANKEVDTWIEEEHEELATEASRDHIYTK